MKKKTAKKVASTVMTAVMITSQVPMVHAYEELTPAVNESSTVRTSQTRAVGETFTQDAITYAAPAILVSGGDLTSASFVDMEEAFAAIAADT